MVVIHIPFVLRYTTIRYSIVAPRPCLMSLAVSGCSCAMPASACACASMDRFMLLGLSLQVYVSSVTVEMNHIHKRMIMPTCANTRGRPTRPVMCNGMIIIIDHFITMTPLDLAPAIEHSPVPSAHTHTISHLHFCNAHGLQLGSAAAATAQRRCRFFASVFERR